MILVTDLNVDNAFSIVGVDRYDRYPPCYPYGSSRDDNRVSEGTKAPSVFKMTLYPWERAAYCETAQEGGLINAAAVSGLLQRNRPLYMKLRKWPRTTEQSIYYIHIESI